MTPELSRAKFSQKSNLKYYQTTPQKKIQVVFFMSIELGLTSYSMALLSGGSLRDVA